jgi:hypothetical protein
MNRKAGSPDLRELDADELLDPKTRAASESLIDEGLALLPVLAEWGRRSRQILDHGFPDEVYEDGDLNATVMRATGLAELNDLMLLAGLVIGARDFTPSDTAAQRLREQYGALIGTD